MKKQKIYSVQDWLPFKKIFDKGIIQLKDFSYVKVLKIFPINFNLKSEIEKEKTHKTHIDKKSGHNERKRRKKSECEMCDY